MVILCRTEAEYDTIVFLSFIFGILSIFTAIIILVIDDFGGFS